MRVLGVDPGLSRCGVGIVEGTGRRPSAVSAGVIRTPTDGSIPQRLHQLHRELTALIERAEPDEVAVERVFFNSNVRTAMGVGQAAGIVMLAAEQAGLPITEYTPTQVKAAVAGTGAADKEQVGFMVRTLLRLVEVPTPADAADALALALCHLNTGTAPGGDGALSPRLAAALEQAAPGAQVLRARR
jgi:crossover junction endodeoxyribonuclease RuvC